MHNVSMFLMCWWGFCRTELCGSASMGLLGVCVFGSLRGCVWFVGDVFSWFVVFSSFLLFFVLFLALAFLCLRRCMIYYEVPGPLYCGGPIGTL